MASDPKLPVGTNFCKCSACGAYFYSVKAFDTHRVGPYVDRRCMTDAEMPNAALSLTEKGYWRLPKRKGEFSK